MTACRLVATLLLGMAIGMPSWAAPALPGDIIADLQAQERRLEQGDLETVSERARSQAQRLAGGNVADRWARALYLQLAASAEARAGRPNTAAELLRQARASDVVEAQQADRWLRQEANLRLAADEAEAGVELLGDWFERHAGNADDRWQMARGLAELERWSAAADWVGRAFEVDDSPDDAQRRLAVVVYQRAGHGERALDVLAEDLDADSDASEWRQAAGLAQQIGAHGQAAALWEAGWRLGVLDGREDRLMLIKLHLAGGTPARAAERLSAALDQEALPDTVENRRLLASAWERARHRDRALEAWQDVAERSENADDWLRLGQLALGWGRDGRARQALDEAAARGAEEAESWLATLEASADERSQERAETGQDLTQVH
ncbi:hypothetical protein [Billgrantia gudaonensis]|uniref:Tetratricopeptide repeat-containing protein n=1 Tax=Billgrantia gudaonensis TaxID=376427 RepID=A0A1G8NDR4_9GAMM|nr:hypothetical protein [Halomonas gudaonensis]SDI78303.1 hypothetical protein SAMN04487954_101300 [Halomonas gudaonensis]